MDTILALDLGRHQQKTHGATFHALGGRGTRFTCTTDAAGLGEVCARARSAGVTHVYFEAQPAAFRVADLVRAHGMTPVIANTHAEGFAARPRGTKSDKLDVDRLGSLALRGEIGGIHVPDQAARHRRSLVELRAALVGEQTAAKNRIRGLAEQEWLPLPEGSSCWSEDGLAALRALAQDARQSAVVRVRIAVLLDQLESLSGSIATVDRTLARLRREDADATRLLTDMPGFGPATTDAFVAFIGNPARTGYSARSAAAATGLAPTQRQSGRTLIPGPISRAGNATLRGYLVEAAHLVIRRYPEWHALYRRLTGGKEDCVTVGKALVAVARRLALTAAALLRSGTPYDPERIMPRSTWLDLHPTPGTATTAS